MYLAAAHHYPVSHRSSHRFSHADTNTILGPLVPVPYLGLALVDQIHAGNKGLVGLVGGKSMEIGACPDSLQGINGLGNLPFHGHFPGNSVADNCTGWKGKFNAGAGGFGSLQGYGVYPHSR